MHDPPESAPAGIRVALLFRRKLLDEDTFFMFWLLHELQVTEEMSELERILSKSFPQSLQEKRYIGIFLLP